jgi:hypothetical protein
VLVRRPESPRSASRYLVLDGRDPKRFADELERLLAEKRLLVVIDGAAGRPKIDAIISDVADLVLLPFGTSAQDAPGRPRTWKLCLRQSPYQTDGQPPRGRQTGQTMAGDGASSAASPAVRIPPRAL